MLLEGPYKKIEPASGAIIMATGIFLIGTVEAFPFLDHQLGKYFAFILLIMWIVIYKSLSFQFFHRDFLVPFLKNPVNSFAMGTWIAGVSVLCNVFLKYFPGIIGMTQAIAIFNTFLFLFFVANCFYNFKQLFFEHRHYPVHGTILLSCVGTQSIMVLLNRAFFQFPAYVTKPVIVLGIMFYIAGMIRLVDRYWRRSDWTIADDWANTNCIIHGALSITGLAIVITDTFSSFFVTVFWIIIFILLCMVEVLEIIRAAKRVKQYGWNKGIFTYDVSQWSRNFTFGMFFTFTLFMHQNPFYTMLEGLHAFQNAFLSVWAWVVLIAILMQIALYIKSRIGKFFISANDSAR